MPKAKPLNNESIAKEETLITPLEADNRELKGTSMEKSMFIAPQGAIPRGNPAIKGVKQDLGGGMSIKYN
jgi:hypothetical protein